MKKIKQLAIIGPTASGKTALAIEYAKKFNAHILSLDSLSIYKEIDIVSAKPTIEERGDIKHFGIDYIYPNEDFDVTTFIDLYKEVYQKCIDDNKALIIVGGTSFYLKMLIDGISQLPTISQNTKRLVEKQLSDVNSSYSILYELDPSFMESIKSNDRYRIEKALNIYFETGLTPSVYFQQNPPIKTIIGDLPIYQINTPKDKLRERILLRTKLMVKDGLIDEICYLESKYGREPNAMKAIGLKETFDYLDGVYDLDMLISKISTNTARLAKRQTTFNNSQFKNIVKGSIEELKELLV